MAEGKSILRRIVAVFDREGTRKAEREFEASLAKAGEKAGGASGKGFLRELRAEFDKKKAQLAIDLARGTINEKEFRKQSEVAARTFNATLIKSIDEARARGELTDREFIKLSRSIKRVGDEGQLSIGQKLTSALKGAALAAAALFSLNAIRRFGEASVRAFGDAEKSARRLQSVWEANAGAVERTFDQLKAFTKELRDTTLFSTDEIELATSQLLTYKSISGDTFESTLRLATDLSSVFGGLTQSTAALARALDDPIRGLGELRRQGFTFSDQVTAQIKLLMEQNRLFDAQKIIIRELDAEVGGVAQKMRTGWVGAVDRFSKAWIDLKEQVGKTLVEAGGGVSIMDTLTAVIKELTVWVERAAPAVRFLGNTFGTLADIINTVLYSALSGVTAALALLAEGYALTGYAAAKFADIIGAEGRAAKIRAEADAVKEQARALRNWAEAADETARAAARSGIARWQAREGTTPEVPTAGPGRGGGGVGEVDEKALKAFRERRIAIEQEIADLRRLDAAYDQSAAAVEDLQKVLRLEGEIRTAQQGLREKDKAQIAELIRLRQAERDKIDEAQKLIAQGQHLSAIAREVEILGRRADALRQGEEAVEALNRELAIEEAILRSGAQAGSEFEAQVRSLAAAHYDAANAVESAWTEAADAIDTEFNALSETIGGVFHAIASGGIAGLARLAKAKVVENLAWALENAAKALGALNPWASAKYSAAAKGHLVAAAKWGVVGAGAALAGSGGGGGGGAPGTAAPNTTAAQRAQPAGPEIHVHFGGEFDMLNPQLQRAVYGTMQKATERFGSNARVYVNGKRQN